MLKVGDVVVVTEGTISLVEGGHAHKGEIGVVTKIGYENWQGKKMCVVRFKWNTSANPFKEDGTRLLEEWLEVI